jgi:hypothetical protein
MSTPTPTGSVRLTGTITMQPPTAAAPDPDSEEPTEADLEAIKDYRAADIASLQALGTSLSSLATGSIDRSRAGAAAIVTAASSITAVYSGLLALVFSLGGTPLPARAVLGPIFLGLAIVLSTAYLSYITAERSKFAVDERGAWGQKIYGRASFLVRYTRGIVVRRVWMLQASVIALGIGAIGLALPFISPGATSLQPPAPTIPIVSWPSPPPASGNADADLALYQAQIDAAVETAKAEAAATDAAALAQAKSEVTSSFTDGWAFFLWFLGIGLGLVVVIPFLTWLFGRRAPD